MLHAAKLSASYNALQLYVDPIGYWKNGYNLFDFLVLCVSGAQTMLSSLNILRNEVVILKVTKGTDDLGPVTFNWLWKLVMHVPKPPCLQPRGGRFTEGTSTTF